MKTTVSKNSIEALSRLSWSVLSSLIKLREPLDFPIYYFLAPWSKGSLRGRSPEEIALVHKQQAVNQGITLLSPPAAWVSRLHQVPEEALHLLALRAKQNELKGVAQKRFSLQDEFCFMTLHEAFAKFGSLLVLGESFKKYRRRSKGSVTTEDHLWMAAHQEGYFLASKMAEAYFQEKFSLRRFKKWFRLNWNQHPKKSLQYLYRLLDESLPSLKN